MHAIQRGTPLPLASISNRRSLIYVGNLVDAIASCCTHPKAAGQTYLVSDGEDVSTPDLVRRIAEAMDTPARIFLFPPSLMRLAGKISGKSSAVERLLGSLQVDSSKIREDLGWKPPFTMDQGLKETVEWFKGILNDG
jgi:nucleoside-diphosphate-sugar epimerase